MAKRGENGNRIRKRDRRKEITGQCKDGTMFVVKVSPCLAGYLSFKRTVVLIREESLSGSNMFCEVSHLGD